MGWSPRAGADDFGMKNPYLGFCHCLTTSIQPSPLEFPLLNQWAEATKQAFVSTHIRWFFLHVLGALHPEDLLEMELLGVPHVGTLGKSNPWYVYSHCVLCKMILSAAEVRKGNLFLCSHFAFFGLPCWYSKISVFNSNRPYSLKNPNHSTWFSFK